MNIHADFAGRYMLRMAAEMEALIAQRDALVEENERLKAELEALKPKPAEEPSKPHLVE